MRQLDTKTLDAAAKYFAIEFDKPDVPHRRAEGKFIGGRALVMQDFFNFTYKDEFEYMLKAIRRRMGPDTLAEFDEAAKEKFTPRSNEVLAQELSDRLAVDTEGKHIEGKVGTSNYGRRIVGMRLGSGGHYVNDYWNIYAGEAEERIRETEADETKPSGHLGVVDELPEGSVPLDLGAFATRISLNFAIAMADAGLLLLDEGTVGAVVEGRTTPRPANVTDAVTGTLLFAVNSDDGVTFAGAVDAGPGAIATAGTIDDDVSADNTGTLLYCRGSSANAVNVPLNDHLEGEAGTASSDFVFNTLAIVSGATVSLTAWTVTQPEA